MSHYFQPVKDSVFIQHAKVAPFTSLTNLQDQDLSEILDKASLVVMRTMWEKLKFLTNPTARMILWLHNYVDG